MKKTDRYYNIVVFLAQTENNPKMPWYECRRLARKWFLNSGFKGVNYKLLKKAWQTFNYASVPTSLRQWK